MMDRTEREAQRVFGQRAAFYSTSPAHTDPAVLSRVVALASPQPEWLTLDIATGAGHTAFALAPRVHSVVGTDLTPEMLAESGRLRDERELTNVVFSLADVHDLPFRPAIFHLVTCRRAAHHFSDIQRALNEMHRVLGRGGRLVIDDRSVPEDDFVDRCMNELDRYHDESHVRQYRASEWRDMMETQSFAVEAIERYTKHRPLGALTEGVSSENVGKIRGVLDRLTSAQREALQLRDVEGEPHLNHWYVLIAAVKRA
jgi:ubiquinone/menaquinone biosynthesis C-methylase UbiE